MDKTQNPNFPPSFQDEKLKLCRWPDLGWDPDPMYRHLYNLEKIAISLCKMG